MSWPFKIVKIAGHSMEPGIRNGQLVWIYGWAYLFGKPRIGEIVVFQNPQNKKQLLCKRVVGTLHGDYILSGDNAGDSLDSRALGPVPAKLIVGRVITAGRRVPKSRLSPHP